MVFKFLGRKKNGKKHEDEHDVELGEDAMGQEHLEGEPPKDASQGPAGEQQRQEEENPEENESLRSEASEDSRDDSLEEPEGNERQESASGVGGSKGFMNRLRRGLSKTRQILTTDIDDLFLGKKRIDDELLEDLEALLITSDMGVETTMELMKGIENQARKLSDGRALKAALKEEILSLLQEAPPVPDLQPVKPYVTMVVGVNGVGKTTTIGKIAARYGYEGKKTLIAAADTFRAAAVEQLGIWAERSGAEFVRGRDKADPAAVAFDAVEASLARDIDICLIDTAGRLHTNVNLMEELKKIKRAIGKTLPGAPHQVLLVLDATTGQNAISQANLFKDAIGVDSIALTKLDGTAKGGVVVSICHNLQMPLQFVGVGEKIDDLQPFDKERFVEALF